MFSDVSDVGEETWISLAKKEVSIISDKSQLSKSLDYIGRKSLGAVQKTVIDPVTDISNINPTLAKAILQGEAGINVSTAKQPIIASFGAGPCVIISIYNKESNTCALAHVDRIANPCEVLCMLSYQLEKDPCGQLIVELATKEIEDNQTLEELKSLISENKNMSLEKLHSSSSLAVDARTGKTFIDVDAYSLDLGLNHKDRMEQRGVQAMPSFGKKLPISLIFDGRNS